MSLLLRAGLLACALGISPASAAVLVTIDKSTQHMTVEVDGKPLYQWPVSTGRAGYDTPNGRFRAFRMERDHFSKEWDDAPMPFSVFFTEKGHAIHGSNDRRIGSPASHGCVRLSVANAETLYALVEQEGVLNTTVVLTGMIPSAAPAVARRRVLPRPDGLDPYAPPEYAQPQVRQRSVAPSGYYYAQPYPYYTAPRGYVYGDPYGAPVYQQRNRGSLFYD